jgi:hypothetical protein
MTTEELIQKHKEIILKLKFMILGFVLGCTFEIGILLLIKNGIL